MIRVSQNSHNSSSNFNSYVGKEKPGPRQGRTSLQEGIDSFLKSIDNGSGETSDFKKAMRAQQVLTKFKQCMQEIYESPEATKLMLDNINAVYILREADKGMLRNTPDNAPLVTKLVIYSCDSTVYAELDSRQEQIKLWFNMNGEKLDKLQLMHSKLGMRRRRPFNQ